MNTLIKKSKPFAFWLVEQFLPVEESDQSETKPISDREFYSTMLMLLVSICALSFAFHITAK